MGGAPAKLEYADAVVPYTALGGEDAAKLWQKFEKIYR